MVSFSDFRDYILFGGTPMKEVPLTCVASKKSYIDRATKEIREFLIYEVILFYMSDSPNR